MYTVKQLADLAGVTVRTLHHYDQFGLLAPSSVGGNGYRYYEEGALYRLQQILFYRELEIPLGEIKRIVTSPDFDILESLNAHRAALEERIERLTRLIEAVDLTTEHLKGKVAMTDAQLFRAFSDEEQDNLAEEAAERWDSETVRESNARWKAYPAEKRQRILEDGNTIYRDLIAQMDEDPGSAQVQHLISRWHAHMQNFWSPNDEQLLGLADLYNEDARFNASFEAMRPGLAKFMRDAVRVYIKDRKQ